MFHKWFLFVIIDKYIKKTRAVHRFMYSKSLGFCCIQIGFRSTVFNFFKVFFMTTTRMNDSRSILYRRTSHYCFFSSNALSTIYQKLEHRCNFYYFWILFTNRIKMNAC